MYNPTVVEVKCAVDNDGALIPSNDQWMTWVEICIHETEDGKTATLWHGDYLMAYFTYDMSDTIIIGYTLPDTHPTNPATIRSIGLIKDYFNQCHSG